MRKLTSAYSAAKARWRCHVGTAQVLFSSRGAGNVRRHIYGLEYTRLPGFIYHFRPFDLCLLPRATIIASCVAMLWSSVCGLPACWPSPSAAAALAAALNWA